MVLKKGDFDMAKGEADALDVILGVAAEEAVQAGYTQITTAHLLIALSRFSEGQVSNHSVLFDELRGEFAALGINPRSFRRRLRGILGRREVRPGGDRIGRSARCKEVFVAAERAASEARETLTPVWLLRSVFMSLADVAPGAAVEGSEADDIPAEL